MDTAEINGTTIAYVRKGAGPPVLFIQGTGCVGEGWRPQVEGLRDAFDCVSFDNRGIGASAPLDGPLTVAQMAEDARGLMDHLGWDRAHVVGHSLGGLIAQRLALLAPARVRSLGLLCTFATGKDAVGLTPWVMWMGLRTRVGTRRMRRGAFLEMVLPPDRLAAEGVDALHERLRFVFGRDLADSPPILMAQMRAMQKDSAASRLGELAAIPTLVLAAQLDRIAGPAKGRPLAEAIAGSRYVELEGEGHACTVTSAERVNDLLREHFSDA